MSIDSTARATLAGSLAWSDAHVSLEAAARDLPPPLHGIRPAGAPHSAWELVEHIRRTQRDILDFCVADRYSELDWPSDYWPPTPEPPDAGAWERSLAQIAADLRALQDLAGDPARDLSAVVDHGTDQSYLRELLLVTDHTAYHVGQLVLLRQLLRSWPAG